MSTRARRRTVSAATALVLAAMVASCTDSAPAQEPGDDPADSNAVAGEPDGADHEDTDRDDAGQNEAEQDEAEQDGAEQDEAEQDGAGAGDHLDVLRAESLHPDVQPAEPGHAYIEFADDRLDFDDVECRIEDVPDAGVFEVTARGQTDLGPAELAWSRTIGADIGWAWEDEYVRLSLLGGTAERELNTNSMVTAQRDEGEETEWLSGSGTIPLVRLVGTEASAAGTIDGLPSSEDPLVGDFVAAVTCP